MTNALALPSLKTSPFPRFLISGAMLLLALATLVVSPQMMAETPKIRAQVDRSHISQNESLNLTLRAYPQGSSKDIDFNKLKQHWDILSSNQANRYNSVNGNVESYSEWRLTIAPKGHGQLAIPVFQYKGAESYPINIQVKENTNAGAAHSNEPVFIDTDIDMDNVYIGQSFRYTVKVFHRINLGGIDPVQLNIPNAKVLPLEATAYRTERQGQQYAIQEYQFVIIPEKAGSLEIPSQAIRVMAASQRRSMFDSGIFGRSGGQMFRFNTTEKTITVKAPPANTDITRWLPSSDVQIQQTWSASPNQIELGTPITRTITVAGANVTGAQIIPLNAPKQPGLKVYPEAPVVEDMIENQQLNGVRQETYALVAQKPGTYELPAVEVQWWDVIQDQPRKAILPATPIEVTGALAQSTEPEIIQYIPDETSSDITRVRAEASSSAWWMWVSAVLLLSNIALLYLWLKARRQPASSAPLDPKKDKPTGQAHVKSTLKALQAACQQGQPADIRSHLILWARCYFNNQQLSKLDEVAERVSEDTAEMIQTLQANLYSHSGDRFATMDYLALFSAIKVESSIKKNLNARHEMSTLPPLNPT